MARRTYKRLPEVDLEQVFRPLRKVRGIDQVALNLEIGKLREALDAGNHWYRVGATVFEILSDSLEMLDAVARPAVGDMIAVEKAIERRRMRRKLLLGGN